MSEAQANAVNNGQPSVSSMCELQAAYALTLQDEWYVENGNIYTMNEGFLVCCATERPTDAVNEQDERHLDFIARAHNAMPSLLERIERLESAARITVENWENGDLAGAVRNLSDVLSEDL